MFLNSKDSRKPMPPYVGRVVFWAWIVYTVMFVTGLAPQEFMHHGILHGLYFVPFIYCALLFGLSVQFFLFFAVIHGFVRTGRAAARGIRNGFLAIATPLLASWNSMR